MKLAKCLLPDGAQGVGVVEGDQLEPLELTSSLPDLSSLLHAEDVRGAVQSLRRGAPLPLEHVRLLAPLDRQEVWAAGVTYRRSQTARMEESEAAADCYDRVYQSDRPELFLKATAHRVSGPGQPLRIRADSLWNVPEPEITLVVSPQLKLVGFTVGNDMSSRDIEGDNPLYLPQAKVYNQCCGIGPWITLADDMPPPEQMSVQLQILRQGQEVFSGDTSAAQMARGFEELIGWLARDNSFPHGALLLTGTGIVPDSNFTLAPGDVVNITVGGVGLLSNPVVQG